MVNQKVDYEKFKESIKKINDKMEPRRKALSKLDMYNLGYLIGGLLIAVTLAIVFAVHVHWALSIVIMIGYFVGLFFVIRKIK